MLEAQGGVVKERCAGKRLHEGAADEQRHVATSPAVAAGGLGAADDGLLEVVRRLPHTSAADAPFASRATLVR